VATSAACTAAGDAKPVIGFNAKARSAIHAECSYTAPNAEENSSGENWLICWSVGIVCERVEAADQIATLAKAEAHARRGLWALLRARIPAFARMARDLSFQHLPNAHPPAEPH
jgi:hypothetical protein